MSNTVTGSVNIETLKSRLHALVVWSQFWFNESLCLHPGYHWRFLTDGVKSPPVPSCTIPKCSKGCKGKTYIRRSAKYFAFARDTKMLGLIPPFVVKRHNLISASTLAFAAQTRSCFRSYQTSHPDTKNMLWGYISKLCRFSNVNGPRPVFKSNE